MELHYDITKQDFIDFNLNYYNNNAIVQRSIRTMRIATAAIVILGGSALMYWLHTLTPVSIAVYVALAAVCFWGTPRYMRHKMIKNIEKILRNAKNKQLCGPKTLKLMDSVSLLEEEDDHGHDELEYDEHIWTSPKNALKMLDAAQNAVCAIDPARAESYRGNAAEYESEIEDIDARLTEIVNNGARNELIFADRFPFLYLAHDYGISYKAAFNSCTTESEPSAQKMVELIQAIEKDHIPAVYTIEMSNGAIARTLADETGVEILNMHSMQTVTQQEFDAGETYLTLMRKNLDAIERGLN